MGKNAENAKKETKMINYPIVRLELQHMKQSIMHALMGYQEEISQSVAKQLEQVIETFDFEQAVENAARESIQDAINQYFKYGDGHEMIKSSVNKAMNDFFRNLDGDT